MQSKRIAQWEKLKALFERALELSTDKREEFFESVRSEEADLGDELKRLVEQHHASGNFLRCDSTVNPASFIIGRVIAPKYRVLRQLGHGGMGAVYLAEDSKLKRNVALKFLPFEIEGDRLFRSRLRMEAQAAAAVDHPYVCKIYDIDDFESKPFIAMEYVDGQTLREKLKSGPIPFSEGLLFSGEIAEALMAVHAHGIVHGDLKPANLMITAEGHVKLLDFGIARRVEKPDTQNAASSDVPEKIFRTSADTLPAQVQAGTLLYMSPEQLHGSPPSIQSDIFSFGLILYEMFTGVHPFAKQTAEASFGAILYEDVNNAPKAESLPQGVKRIVCGMLAKRSSDRYASVEAILLDLRKARPGNAVDALKSSQPVRAIAVLPFSDLSPAADQEYFCHGVAEELINALVTIDGLRVASRASSFRFRNNELDPAEIGRRLKVDCIVDGSVRKVGNKVRVAVSLIEVESGYQTWSERYDRSLSDIFEIQDEIATSIVQRFQTSDSQPTKLAASVRPNIAAYELYLKGRYQWNKRNEAALGASIDCYYQAIALDPSYAAAYAGLADSYVTLGLYGIGAPADTTMLARSAAEAALKISRGSVEAMTSLASVRCVYEWKWETGEREFRNAIKELPSYSTAHQWYANLCLVPLGRFGEARLELEYALELDEASLAIDASIGVLLYFERRYEEAIEQQRRILQTTSGFGMGYYFLGQAYTDSGLLDDAVTTLERAADLTGRSSESLVMLGRALAMRGKTGEAQKIFYELLDRSNRVYVSPVLFAILAIGLGEFDRALEYLHRAVKVRATDLIWINVRPLFDAVRIRPDFVEICKHVGLIGPDSAR
jgi:serine/threonine protein kinase